MPTLVVLGTAALAPTRTRNHNGYVLTWDGEVLLFDPGEGTQRQLLHADFSVARISRVCISHFHGDHCLGLPGVLQRRSIDPHPRPLDVYFPRSGLERVRRLIDATEWDVDTLEIRLHPVDDGMTIPLDPTTSLHARALDHTVDVLGWRVEEIPRRHFIERRLHELGIDGADVGRLRREGSLEVGGRIVHIEEVSEQRQGQCVAFVMDTRPCAAAVELARDADMLVCEATYLERDAALAAPSGHLTAMDAARIAQQANVDLLVLSHFSDRYGDVREFELEAGSMFTEVIAATDLMVIPVPKPRDDRDERSPNPF
jgi:ribonuclease Z